jgi:hypothetical protein
VTDNMERVLPDIDADHRFSGVGSPPVNPGLAVCHAPPDRSRRRGRPRCPPAVLFLAAVRRNHFPLAAKPSGNSHSLASAPVKHTRSV